MIGRALQKTPALLLGLAWLWAGATACVAPQDSGLDPGKGDVSGVLLPPSAAVTVTDARTMAWLETQGFSFYDALGIADFRDKLADTGRAQAVMMEAKAFVDIEKIIEAELTGKVIRSPDGRFITDDRYKNIPPEGAPLLPGAPNLPNYAQSVGAGPRFGFRTFDVEWLRSRNATVELVAISNGIDGRLTNARSCGDIRLIYRLALHPAGRPLTMLPFTFQVRYQQRAGGTADDCRDVAQRWLDVPGKSPEHLLATVLRPELAPQGKLRDFFGIDIDYQSMHQSSELNDPDDHAEYVVRVFDGTRAGVAPGLLPMMPAPGTWLRADLTQWVKDNLEKIDLGVPSLPRDTRLAFYGISYSTRGMARRLNRPFGDVLEESDFGNDAQVMARLAQTKTVKTPEALIRRLDSLTCVGCHQMRSVAGFQVLGETRPDDDRPQTGNAMHVGISPHLQLEETGYRTAYMKALDSGEARDGWAVPLPVVGRSGVDVVDGRFIDGATRAPAGSHCGLNGAFADWQCADGLACVDVNGDERLFELGVFNGPARVGVCVSKTTTVGDPAEPSSVSPRFRPVSDPADKGRLRQHALQGDLVSHSVGTMPCAGLSAGPFAGRPAVALPNKNGFPGGMCTVKCEPGEEGKVHTDAAGSYVCGRVPELKFEEFCYFKHGTLEYQTTPIEDCLVNGEGGRKQSDFWVLRACDEQHACRDDYACARVEGEGGKTVGACVPPYFLFQLRVDGPPTDREQASVAP